MPGLFQAVQQGAQTPVSYTHLDVYKRQAQIIIGFLNRNKEISFYVLWCVLALAGFLVRSALYSLALSLSHKSTFSILKSIRERILEKLPRMPLGTVMDTPSGQMKQIIVDQVESICLLYTSRCV